MAIQTSVNSTNNLQRSVFVTYLQNLINPTGILDFGSLQFGIGRNDQSQIIFVALYRSRANQITDLSELANVSVTSDTEFEVSLDSGKVSDHDICLGFSIQIVSWGSSPSFLGSIKQTSGITWGWHGQFVTVDATPLTALLTPPVTIPQDIVDFLNISSFTPDVASGNDQAKNWGDDIFEDIMLHALSAQGKKDFFQSLGPLGSFFATKDLPDKQIPTDSPLAASSGPLSLASILSDDQQMFQDLGVHIVCHALKSAPWLDSATQGGISDLASQFINMLICQSAELTANEQAYGAQMPLVISNQIPALRMAYRDAATRCYLAAWVSFCPQLNAFTSTTAQSMYDRVTSTLRSDMYIAHSINVDEDATSAEAAGEFSIQLGMLHDKLVLLNLLAGATTTSPDWQACKQDINKTINRLQIGGAATGFFGETNITMRSEDFRVELKINDIFSDQEILKMWVSQSIMSRPVAVRVGYVPSQQFDYRSYEADQYLVNSATSLGLYTVPPVPSPSCVIF
ncbi:hypothetical protein FOBRF1_006536 [Fusarium oxysporum]